MLSSCNWAESRSYRSGTEHEPIEFYLNGLTESSEIHLLLGYFSSAAINLLALGFASFISKGGRMRLVINQFLSEKDKIALVEDVGPAGQSLLDLTDFNNLYKTLSEYDEHFFQCLAYLITQDRIKIKIIRPRDSSGIVHYKEGVFCDEHHKVGYSGSCNFTYYGLAENKEKINIFLDWQDETSKRFVENNLQIINDYFDEIDDSVEYLNPVDIVVAVRDKFGNKNLDELLIAESQLRDKKRVLTESDHFKKVLERFRVDGNSRSVMPRFPFESGPREYQEKAYQNWVANGHRGMFAMATGTGKTITALNCLLQLFIKERNYQVLILVPTKSLVDQWEKECVKFNFIDNLIKVSSSYNWIFEFSQLETMRHLKPDISYVVISTYASFLTSKFQALMKSLDSQTLFIADECHNMGAPRFLKKLNSIKFNRRIGLSATPDRQFQEDINLKISHFFEEKNPENYVFNYGMFDAIKNEPRALCPYRYYPKIVELTEDEFQLYVDYTRRIGAMRPKSEEEKEIFNRLCIARQRVIHKAKNKLNALKEIVLDEYDKRGNLKYTLIYVPEGLSDEGNGADLSDSVLESDSDKYLLNKYTKVFSDLFNNVSVRQFIGTTLPDERIKILRDFAEGDLDVITSMKCLDEGIDVPRAELAIFCASTGNPRQFIQRRGRVLRLAEGKDEATIYDLVVIPHSTGDESLFQIERNEIEKELRRIRDFAEMSENLHYTREILDPILKFYKLSL